MIAQPTDVPADDRIPPHAEQPRKNPVKLTNARRLAGMEPRRPLSGLDSPDLKRGSGERGPAAWRV